MGLLRVQTVLTTPVHRRRVLTLRIRLNLNLRAVRVEHLARDTLSIPIQGGLVAHKRQRPVRQGSIRPLLVDPILVLVEEVTTIDLVRGVPGLDLVALGEDLPVGGEG